jgi:GTP-binding protein
VIDTGGMGGEHFAEEIQQQVNTALKTADIVLFVFDSQVGLTPLDEELARELQKSGLPKKTPVIGVVNKVDAEVHESRISDFYELGFDQIVTVSSEHARGIDDLKLLVQGTVTPDFNNTPASQEEYEEELEVEFEEDEETTEEDFSEELPDDLETESDQELLEENDETEKSDYEVKTPRVAIVGRPNVGKSTLLNALLGESRVITSPIAGTTVDSVDVEISFHDKPFILVDTAGVRRKSKTEQGVEVLSVVQTKKALERADIAILILDGENGIVDQDEKIGGLIEEAGCSVILAMNKWDTQRKNPKFTQALAAERIRKKMGYLKYAPVMFMSAIRGEGIDQLGDLIEEILHQRKFKIPTREFTEWVRKESTVHNPGNAKFYLCHQAGRNPPTFVCHVNNPDKIHFSLKRYLLNTLREKWGYMGTPIRLLFVEGKNSRKMPKSVKNKSTKLSKSYQK